MARYKVRAERDTSSRAGALRVETPRPAFATVAGRPGERLDYDPGVALQGKRIVITGGAGFIGTTLARRLVDANEVIAVDNLHRDALSGTELEGHPSFRFEEGDVLDPARLTELFAGATLQPEQGGQAAVHMGLPELTPRAV